MTLGAGDRPLFRCLRHDISERIVRRPFRRRRLYRDRILVSDHALGRDTTQAPLRPQGIRRSDSQDVRRKSHPVYLHAKPAVPPARAPVDDTTGTVGDNADRGCIARTTRRACQRNGYLGSRRACLRVRDPSSSPAFARSLNSDASTQSTASCRAISSPRLAHTRTVLLDFRLICHVRCLPLVAIAYFTYAYGEGIQRAISHWRYPHSRLRIAGRSRCLCAARAE